MMRHEKYRVDHKFHVGDYVWLHLSKESLQGPTKKLKPIKYGPFDILEQVSENAFRLNLPKYMNIYLVVNVEHLKLNEPYILTKDELDSDHILPSIDELAPNTMDELKEDSILQKKVHAIRRCEIELWLVGLKGKKPNKAKWMDRSRVWDLYPHLCICGTKCFFIGEV